MSTPYLAEIRIFAFDWAPSGWALCNGALLPIQQNQSLYSLLGTMYGGDGRTTFGLPNLQGRVAVSADATHPEGAAGGSETATVPLGSMASHQHAVRGTNLQAGAGAAGKLLAKGGGQGRLSGPIVYAPDAGNRVSLNTTTIGMTGGSTAHSNMQPSLTLNYTIAIQGLFPPRN